MVRAILDGSKTQTRRVVKGAGDMEFDKHDPTYGPYWLPYMTGVPESVKVRCPYGAPGDRLWVRETWAIGIEGCDKGISYRADHVDARGDGPANPMKWRPSIFMPRWASRILLEITEIRVQRLQDISPDDAEAEGVDVIGCAFPRGGSIRIDAFARLWESINGAGSWDANPWVWAITFRRLQP